MWQLHKLRVDSGQMKVQEAPADMSRTREDQRKVDKKILSMIQSMVVAEEKENWSDLFVGV